MPATTDRRPVTADELLIDPDGLYTAAEVEGMLRLWGDRQETPAEAAERVVRPILALARERIRAIPLSPARVYGGVRGVAVTVYDMPTEGRADGR